MTIKYYAHISEPTKPVSEVTIIDNRRYGDSEVIIKNIETEFVHTTDLLELEACISKYNWVEWKDGRTLGEVLKDV